MSSAAFRTRAYIEDVRTLGDVAVPVADRVQETGTRERRLDDVLSAGAYAVLGLVLLATRLVGLDRSFWSDEVVTVTDYVRAGPRGILAGPYIPNNHELYSLLGCATSSMVGESEVALRLLAVVPFLVGVALCTAWLHVRVSRLSGVLFLFFATASPLLYDLSRQARGYGLAFLAMSVLIVSALEADRTASRRWLAAFFVSGLVGTLTLPIFGLAFFATALALLAIPSLPRRVVVGGTAASALATAAWYAPHADDILHSSQQEYGAQIPWYGLPASPIDQVLVPGVLWFGDTFLASYPARAIVIAAAAVMLLSSPLLRSRAAIFVLCSGTVATLFFIWAARLYLAQRFLSYLLVPLFILLATGTAHVLRNSRRRPGLRTLVAMLTLAVAAAAFGGAAPHLLRHPTEAWKDAAVAIEESDWSGRPVLAYTSRPQGLRYYLRAPVIQLQPSQVASSVCRPRHAVVYVDNSFETVPVEVPCLRRDGVRHIRLQQHSYGGETNVWLLPARS